MVGTIGGSVDEMVTAQFAFDTGKESILSAVWRFPLVGNVSSIERRDPRRLNAANGRPVELG